MPILDLSNAKYSLSVAGEDMSLISISIALQFNSPTKISCKAVPSSVARQKVVDMSNGDLFWSCLAKLDSEVGKPVVSLSVSNLGDGTDFSFNASNWILADVNLSAMATAGSPEVISFSMLHPISSLGKYPTHVGPVKHSPIVDRIAGSTYLDVVKSALTEYSNVIVDSAKKQPAYSLLQEGISELATYIKCEGCDVSNLLQIFSWSSNKSSLELGFKRFILSCVENGSDGQNLLSFVAQTLASDFSLALYHDTSDLAAKQMILKPKVPYTPELVTIKQSRIQQISSNLGDWLAITGVSAQTSEVRKPQSNIPRLGQLGTVEPAYVSVLAKDGGFQTASARMPGWYDGILNSSYASNSFSNKPSRVENLGELPAIVQEPSIKKVLTQDFLEAYRQSRTVSASCLFSASDDSGKLIVPGLSCKISGGSSGGLLFFVNSVVHNFSLLSNTASTDVSGNYVRAADFSVTAEGAEDADVISGGFSKDKNYIWG